MVEAEEGGFTRTFVKLFSFARAGQDQRVYNRDREAGLEKKVCTAFLFFLETGFQDIRWFLTGTSSSQALWTNSLVEMLAKGLFT